MYAELLWKRWQPRISGGSLYNVQNIKKSVLEFSPFSEIICTLRLKGVSYNITFITTYAPTEEADDEAKVAFYEAYIDVYKRQP